MGGAPPLSCCKEGGAFTINNYFCPAMQNGTGHTTTELARLFFIEMMKVHTNGDWTAGQKVDALARLMELLFIEVTKAEHIRFTTLFARISYACHQYSLHKRTQYWIHFFRKKHRSGVAEGELERLYLLGFKTLAQCVAGLFGEAIPDEVLNQIPPSPPYEYREVKIRDFRSQVRVVALQDDPENNCLLARDEANPSEAVLVRYNIAGRNESFNAAIRQIRSTFGLPVTLSLLDVEVDDKGVYRPKAIVVEPDYLLDATAVAYCFQGTGPEPIVYLLNKYLPYEQSIPLILGNIANFFLDELMNDPQAAFKDTFPKVFKTNPLTFALLPDAAIREIYQKSQKHWLTLRYMVTQGLKEKDIEPDECYLEPSFYDEVHGLQGRLDIFYKKEKNSAIVELKSGKPFMPNKHGIGASHFIQTLLYDLMVKSVFDEKIDNACFILYSGLDTDQLRYAPPVKAEQYEAMQVRNQLVAIDRLLANISTGAARVPLFQRIRTDRFSHIRGYLIKSIERFEKAYASLSDLEQRYFNAFSGFIAREHQLAKTGIQGVDNANGLAALWLDTFEEKERNYQVVRGLRIKDNRAGEDEPLLVFEKSQATNPLANFRKGDIAVLYPSAPGGGRDAAPQARSPVATQIFKVTLIELTPETVTVRLRYKQFNKAIFEKHKWWNLEHDQMDTGFHALYQGLFRFAESDPQKRNLLLTTRPPARPAATPAFRLPDTGPIMLTDEQRSILQKMLAAPEYFLLWGPPGTGKTSQMLKNYIQWVFENTDENLLVLAYTNRAVDEICEAIQSIGEKAKAACLRIGSVYSASQRFENQLLTKKIAGVANRRELLEVLGRHRIFVSTLASLSGNLQLLKLKNFRRAVIDEASQILEPMLVGLLPHFKQFVLIGDHKQLPAVVVQEASASVVDDEKLKAIGLHNLRNSLFERLYKRCMEEGWHHACDHLSHQGRMHKDIMRFPGENFYEGKLKILPPEIPLSQKQTAPIPFHPGADQPDWQTAISLNRLVFISTPADGQTPSQKTNRYEAEQIAALVRFFRNDTPARSDSPPPSIGIITPYRAQIAQIQEILQKEGIPTAGITIDTVERYQGGARDIILISLCTNVASQMDSLVSLSDEGVDRKLNVALTRAREHIVVLGNEKILQSNEVYRKLIRFCKGNQVLQERAS
ncbi:MAG TPA: DEAD/DEAH box helicase [Bacteroidetes bacterium]|nr:DEAD/DEAH box helicase [Bacteroidota bacterium]